MTKICMPLQSGTVSNVSFSLNGVGREDCKNESKGQKIRRRGVTDQSLPIRFVCDLRSVVVFICVLEHGLELGTIHGLFRSVLFCSFLFCSFYRWLRVPCYCSAVAVYSIGNRFFLSVGPKCHQFRIQYRAFAAAQLGDGC